MLDRLKALFSEEDSASSAGRRGRRNPEDLDLAVAVLLVEAARMDGNFDADEREAIGQMIRDRLSLDAADADDLIDEAERRAIETGEYWSFAKVVKNAFSYEERVELIEMLWGVAYADGALHDYEASLLRRITGLLYVSDQDSGAARKRVLERLGMSDD